MGGIGRSGEAYGTSEPKWMWDKPKDTYKGQGRVRGKKA
jgi:hypothetical protein